MKISCVGKGVLQILSLLLLEFLRVYSKKHVKKERSRERAELAKAWNLLDPLGKGVFNQAYDHSITQFVNQ